MDWARAYDAGLTPWDLRGAAEPLRVLAAEGYFSRLDLPQPVRVAVPGCGRGHDLKVFAELGMEVTGFDLAEDAVVVECPIHDRRHVRSSSGHVEERIVVIMRIALLGREIETEMTLSNRDEMGFRMLIGRQALRQGFLVDPAKSFLGGRAPREIRRRNRDR